MKRCFVIVVLALSFATAGCGGGGGANVFALLRDCGVSGLLNLLSVVERLGDVLQEIEGGDLPNVVVTETGENAYSFSISVDVDGDGIAEPPITGTWSFDTDVSGGVPNGTVSTLAFSQVANSQQPDVTGSGLQVTFITSNQISVVGAVDVLDTLNCDVTLAMPAGDPLLIDFSDFDEARVAVNIANLLNVSGEVGLDITRGGDNLLTTLLLSSFSNNVTFTDNELNGAALEDVQEQAFLSDEEFSALQQCMFTSFLIFSLGGVLEDVLDGESGSALLQGDTFNYTLTPVVGGAQFEFDLDATDTDAGLGLDVTITARVTFSQSPSTPSYDGTADISRWNVVVNQTPAQLAGIPFFFTDLTANHTARTFITFDDGDAESVYGGGEFNAGNGLCTGTIDIPATNPVFIFGFNGPQPGRATVNFKSSGITILTGGLPESITLSSTLVFLDSEFSNNVLFTSTVINGIPVPGNLLERLLFLVF